MKYLWLNKNDKNDTQNIMQSGGSFITIKMLDNQQRHSPKKVKRFRSAFTTDQLNYLEKQFKKFPYIGNAHRKEVANALNIPERAVKIWFQNRRMKEKKESTTKELESECGIPISLEFDKNQLNNASASSANEQPWSLPLLTDTTKTCSSKNIIKNKTTCNMITRHMVQDLGVKDTQGNNTVNVSKNIVTTAKVVHPPSVFIKSNQHSPPDYKNSAEFSIDLCKKYKAVPLCSPPQVETTLKKEIVDVKNTPEKQFVAPAEQMIPEDLSASRKTAFPPTITHQVFPTGNTSNPGYVSLVPTVPPFYAQPYMSASGVIWKPVNVVPIVSSNASAISTPSNQFVNMPPVQESVIKRCCNCDCHVKTQGRFDFQPQSPSPQYIITAVPYQNSSSKFDHRS